MKQQHIGNIKNMSIYHRQIRCAAEDIDLEFWKAPEGVAVPDDELNFLLVPDTVEAAAIFALAQLVHNYQQAQPASGAAITRALMVTMGGMLPGILLHDHLAKGQLAGTSRIEFGTVGVSLYKGLDERHPSPRVQQGPSIPVQGETVLVIEDLGDRGDTLLFLKRFLAEQGAKQVLTLALYMKPQALRTCPVDFYFGQVPQDTWIITPREYVETLVKRVPLWQQRGADRDECYRRLVDLIGYPAPLADYYLQRLFAGD
jgi:hypoxanthine phosphoribosyltransferase